MKLLKYIFQFVMFYIVHEIGYWRGRNFDRMDQEQCRFSELPRLLPCPHGFRSEEECPTCRHFQKVRESK